jgi:hypothetical protein
MNLFAEDGIGVMAAPTVLENEPRRRYEVEVVGRAADIRQRF